MNTFWNLTQCCAPIKCKKKCKYYQPPRPKPYTPEITYEPPDVPMEDTTIYSRSYAPIVEVEDDHCQDRFPCNPCCEEGNGSTIEICCPAPNCQPECPVYPNNCSVCSNSCPFYNTYCPICPFQQDRVVNLHQNVNVDRPCGKFSDTTVYKSSYQPWNLERKDMPWKKKQTFEPPKLRMETTTVQKLSYGSPREYMRYMDDGAICSCCVCNPSCMPCMPMPKPPPIPQPPCEGRVLCCNQCCNFHN